MAVAPGAPWTVAQAISPEGQWGKIWLAAHWDKKLKKEDFLDANIHQLVGSILNNSEKLTLRYMGNFLLGLCKIHAKQCFFFEERARDLSDNLMTAFDQEAAKKRRTIGGAEARAAATEAAADAFVVDEELERVLASRRHLAQIEDITLKPAMEDALALGSASGMLIDTFGPTSAGDQAALLKLTKHTKRAFLGEALVLAAPDTLVPLVDNMPEGRGLSGALGDADPSGLLDMDLDPLAEDANVDMGDPVPLADGEDGALVGAGAGDEPTVKRRRRAFMFDDPAEIPKETYQGYMNDRSGITRKEDSQYDSTIMLPHNHPSMPRFTTTYTDMCNSLIQCLSWGSQVADRRRHVLAMAESSAVPMALGGMWPEAAAPAASAPELTGESELPGAAAPLPDVGQWEQTAVHLDLSDAPEKMSMVTSSGNVEQDESQSADVSRVGYSGRTEKMHKFLAKEFQRSSSSSASASSPSALSYEQMCKRQASGDRGVIAGCFFELLVLRTNGVVNLCQEKPYSDVRIEKANAWGTTSS